MTKTKETKDTAGLESFILDTNKKFGDGSIFSIHSHLNKKIDVIPTNVLSFDMITGVGGLPKGRIIELIGDFSTGKSTLSLHAMAECNRLGMNGLFIDMEHAIDLNYAYKLGVNKDMILISQPEYGEQALDILEAAIDSDNFGLIIVDSVAALVPQAEVEGEMTDNHMGIHARMMGQALRKITPKAGKHGVVVIFTNQIRDSIGPFAGKATPGGKALKFFTTMRFELNRVFGGDIKKGEDKTGNKIKIKCIKNKVAVPSKECIVDAVYGEGFSKFNDVFNIAEKHGIVKKAGSWVSYEETKIQGTESFIKLMKEDVAMYTKIYDAVLEKLNPKVDLVDQNQEEQPQ